MDCYAVNALICLKDDLGLEYVVSQIEYKLWRNEEFEYTFRPNYSVIQLLDSSLFQGIPGIDLEKRKEEYVRRNTVPTFISERAPGANREELWRLLEDCNMEYLNQLEWLIRTDTKYIGDRLYVRKPKADKSSDIVNLDNELTRLKRSYDIQKALLQNICLGYDIEYKGFIIDDINRKTCYDLLYRLFEREATRLKKLQNDGINNARKSGKYSGRKSIQVDDTKFYEVVGKYRNHRINAEEAAKMLNMSTATFYRRIRKLK
ncbi:MAG: recombinase family protein [Ruminococcaceae bacterium]|nr:recombinase family protein [Oscillospiraceae bacterium]